MDGRKPSDRAVFSTTSSCRGLGSEGVFGSTTGGGAPSRVKDATGARYTAGIPGGPINVVREDPENPDILYVGTDVGVYVSTDGATTWQALANGLPSTFVHDLIIHPRDDIMVIATHGRGMYAMDVRPIRGEEPEEEPAERPRRRRRGGDEENEERRDGDGGERRGS